MEHTRISYKWEKKYKVSTEIVSKKNNEYTTERPVRRNWKLK